MHERTLGLLLVILRFLITFAVLFLFSYVMYQLTHSVIISLGALLCIQLGYVIYRYLKESS